MTEKEWLGAEAHSMGGEMVRQFVGDEPLLRTDDLDRKLRLYACASLRKSGWDDVFGWGAESVVLAAERFADGLIGEAARSAACEEFWATKCGGCMPMDGRLGVLRAINWNAKWIADDVEYGHPELVRQIFGNPFRPVRWCPLCPPGDLRRCARRQAIVGPTVRSLAQAAYAERTDRGELEAARLFVLADALEEAGLEQEHPILAQLRSSGPSYRGNWALDAVLF